MTDSLLKFQELMRLKLNFKFKQVKFTPPHNFQTKATSIVCYASFVLFVFKKSYSINSKRTHGI